MSLFHRKPKRHAVNCQNHATEYACYSPAGHSGLHDNPEYGYKWTNNGLFVFSYEEYYGYSTEPGDDTVPFS